MRAFFREILGALILAVIIFFLLQATVQSFIVDGASMEPGFEEGQRLLIIRNKVLYTFHEPERGDVIIFHPPNNPDPKATPFIKRIIALPGESVEIKKGTVYIHKEDGNILPLDEPYIKEPPRRDFRGDIIPEDEYFVLGDNRNNSNDSRNGWTVSRQDIIGKAWLKIWPLSEWGLISNYSLEEQLASAMSE